MFTCLGLHATAAGQRLTKDDEGFQLQCERDNPVDENAIQVWRSGEFVGRLARQEAAVLSPLLAAGLLDCVSSRVRLSFAGSSNPWSAASEYQLMVQQDQEAKLFVVSPSHQRSTVETAFAKISFGYS